MIKNIRTALFFYTDLALPRFVASIPYYLALIILKLRLSKIMGVEVWHRNSFKKGNYVFGLSDLDITILVPKIQYKKHSGEILSILKSHKKFFPFLGETNLYIPELIQVASASLNVFERLRDPILSFKLPPQTDHDPQIEKIVFLLRMLNSDKEKLTNFSYLRQKKWKNHLQELGFETNEKITRKFIIDIIMDLASFPKVQQSELRDSLEILTSLAIKDHDIYHMDLPHLWRFIFPHKFIWDEDRLNTNLSSISTTAIEKICIRQLNWEIWGIMSQLPFLPASLDVTTHLRRQSNLALALGDTSTYERFELVIDLAEDLRN
jgi:hypothetical protein